MTNSPSRPETPALDIYDNVWDSIHYWVETAPDLPAITQNGETWSYGRLGRAVESTAAFLRAQDVGAGDRVLLVMENSVAAVAGMLAAMKLGAWAIPLNARLSDREIDEIRKHATPRVTLYTAAISKDAAAQGIRHGATTAPSLEAIGATFAPAEGIVHPEPGFGPMRDRVAALIYTSGTTGAPKGVMLTHGNLLFIAGRSSQARQMSPADKVYAVLPISHVFGLASVFLGNMYRGSHLFLVSRFVPAEAARALAEEGITAFHGVPAMFSHLAG
ncbi:MAG: acyl--CoA ligase, partial [Alphaproteobacteria bacterium]|nr:acyl--CoA ligase [Alphaproteobacteria bacterium]